LAKSPLHFSPNQKMDEILARLEKIEQLIQEQSLYAKEVLNFPETAKYLEVSHSHLYKLTSAGEIPFYKPCGKKLYFNRKEIDDWLQQNRSSTKDEIERQAANYLIKKGRVKL